MENTWVFVGAQLTVQFGRLAPEAEAGMPVLTELQTATLPVPAPGDLADLADRVQAAYRELVARGQSQQEQS